MVLGAGPAPRAAIHGEELRGRAFADVADAIQGIG